MSIGVRTGFIMRTFLPLGPLTVTRGYGGWGDEIIVFPTEELFKVGKGRKTEIAASVREAPVPIAHKRLKKGCS